MRKVTYPTPNTGAEGLPFTQQEKSVSRINRFKRSISNHFDHCKSLGHSGFQYASMDTVKSLYSLGIRGIKSTVTGGLSIAASAVRGTSQAINNNTPEILKCILRTGRYETIEFLKYLANSPGVTMGLALKQLENIYGVEAVANARAGLDAYKMDGMGKAAGKLFTDGPSQETWGIGGSEFNQTVRVETASYLVWLCEQLVTQPLAEFQGDLNQAFTCSTALAPPNQ